MDDVCPESVDRPLLVCGMHRSGTSLTASLFHAAGVRLGDRLLGANVGNDRGHFEDLDVYEFHQAALRSNGLGTEGYLAAGSVVVPEPLEPIGRRLAADRARGGGVWGWKEPRTVLFLDFWERILPEARFLFVFRRPWEVLDSLFRRGNAEFLAEPRLALRVWRHYNERILRFARRAADRCLVVEASQVVADQAGVAAAVRRRLDLPLSVPSAECEPRLFHSDHASWRPWLVRQLDPLAHELYLELRSLAGSDSPLPPLGDEAGGMENALRVALAEWSRASAPR
jgi:hypothetical protein